MTLDPSNQSGSGSGAILRALGSLIAALGADGDRAEAGEVIRAAAPPPRVPAPSPAPPAPAQPAQSAQPAPSRPTAAPGAPRVEAEMLLADARQRAERILQDSMERATDLLNRERAASTGAASAIEVETIRRSVDDLVVGMRDVQSRLARIESIISSQRVSAPAAPPQSAPAQSAPPPAPPAPPVQSAPPAAPPPAAPSTPPAPQQRPAFSRPSEDERRPGGLSVVPERPRPTSPPPPPSVVPPMRGNSQPAAAHAPFRSEPEVIESETVPERSAPTSMPTSMGGGALAGASIGSAAADLWERDDTDDVAGTLATFTPADGSVQLRAAPVSGFQGLMRLQDALQRIPAVRQATVEAYSQGEARLRLELVADVDSDEIAEGLGAGLGQSAVVQEASEAERSITIAFG